MISKIKAKIKRKLRRLASKIIYPINQRRKIIEDEKLKLHSNTIIKKYGYEKIELLGQGKDGLVYKVQKDKALYVIKVLSQYGKSFLPLTANFINKNIKDSMLYDVSIIDNNILVYDYEQLENIDINPSSLLELYIKICGLQIKLLKNNLLYWDFGFKHLNFMEKIGDKQIKLIDYGGNAFLQLKPEIDVNIVGKKKNLIYANNDFIKYTLISHLITHGVGKFSFQTWVSSIQLDFSELEILHNTAEKILSGSAFDEIYKFILKTDFLTIKGWDNFCKLLQDQVENTKIWNLEDADIDKITYENNQVHVRGYQNYDLTHIHMSPLNIGHAWTLSEKKFNLVQKAIQKTNGKTYLDIGSNLGMYVFAACVKNDMDATGLDYNHKYIKECNKISEHLNIQCKFENTPFTEINKQYDIVSCLGLIHHIYQRTENFGSLKPILDKLSNLCKISLIVEFPTENDLKAVEWTNITTRKNKEQYSLSNFLKYGHELFSTVELIGYVTNDRPIYLLIK